MDNLVRTAVFDDEKAGGFSRGLIKARALEQGVFPASVYSLYKALGEGRIPHGFVVPAINIRGMTYDCARAVFRVAKKLKVGTFIFELARSEMEYTSQTPDEYASVVLAAAVREGWVGPVYVQGDHFQFKSAGGEELSELKDLVGEAIAAGFFNIDIDASTLVNLSVSDVAEQQKLNIERTVELAKFVRLIQPEGVTVAVGGEIGHIGGRNSTVEDLVAFVDGFLSKWDSNVPGLSKISVQTGTRHGGFVLPTGALGKADVDFNAISTLSKVCREKYKIAGIVQHGASTLPDEFFGKLPAAGVVETHLATGVQNLIMDHPDFPKMLLGEIYAWIDSKLAREREEGWTDEQFHYRLRKKAWGVFKKEFWDIDADAKGKILKTLEDRLTSIFTYLSTR